MDYTFLDIDQQAAIAESQVRDLERAHFTERLRRFQLAATHVGADDHARAMKAEALAASDEVLASIETAAAPMRAEHKRLRTAADKAAAARAKAAAKP